MKVLFVSNDPLIFIPESAVRARMRAYAEAIGVLHIVSRGPTGGESETREDLPDGGVLILHNLGASKASALLAAPKFIKQIINREGIEVVSAQDPFEHGWIAREAVKHTNARLHVQVHTDFLSPGFTAGISRMAFLNRARLRIAEQVLPNAQGIRVVSVRIKNRMLAEYGSRIVKPVVIPVPMSSASEIEAVDFPSHEFSHTILAVGRLEEEKRFQDLIRALTGVQAHYPSVGLFIAGEGRQRTFLEKLARDLDVADRVIFLGARADARGLMKRANLFVQTSAYEGYGLTLLEAALAGLPIITTDVGVVGEVLKKDRDVAVIPFANPASLAHEIIGLIEDPARASELGAQAAQTVQEYLKNSSSSPEEIARNLKEVLSSTI